MSSTQNLATQQPQCICTSTNGTPKSSFPSQQAAESWFAFNQKKFGWDAQRAYKCPNSSFWHLTADLEAKQPTPVQVNYKAASAPEKLARAARGSVRDAVHGLLSREPNLMPTEIAKRLGMNLVSVKNAFYTYKKESKSAAPVKSLSGIADRKKQLAEEMAKLEASEKQLREALLPKVQLFGNNGETQVRIVVHSQPLIVTLEEGRLLGALLVEKVGVA
jgi:hypothetical protein